VATGIGVALKNFIVWLFSTTTGKAILKAVVPIMLIALFAVAVTGLGFLPRSPLYEANRALLGLSMYVPYLRYVSAFVPIEHITTTLGLWLASIMLFHSAKVYLRVGKISKG